MNGAGLQRGGLSSPANHPTASVCIGSTDMETCSVRSQVEHSNVRTSKPRSPGEMRASAIRCLHVGHIGRSLVGLPMTPWPEGIIPKLPLRAAKYARQDDIFDGHSTVGTATSRMS